MHCVCQCSFVNFTQYIRGICSLDAHDTIASIHFEQAFLTNCIVLT